MGELSCVRASCVRASRVEMSGLGLSRVVSGLQPSCVGASRVVSGASRVVSGRAELCRGIVSRVVSWASRVVSRSPGESIGYSINIFPMRECNLLMTASPTRNSAHAFSTFPTCLALPANVRLFFGGLCYPIP